MSSTCSAALGRGRRDIGGSSKRLLQFQLVVLLLVVLTSLARNIDAVHASGMCVQIGQANNNHLYHTSYDDQRRMGPFTMGARKFDIKIDYLDFMCYNPKGCYDESDLRVTCPYTIIRPDDLHAEACVPQSTVELRTLAVKQNGKVMAGWLHFEFELVDKKDSIIAIYVQVRDEFYNAIGEFVSDPKEQCYPTNPELVQPTEYQILPCSAVGYREAKASNAVFMAASWTFKKEKIASKYIPKKSISAGIHFTWRLSEYWCNRHLRFRPEATILTWDGYQAGKSKPPRIYRKAASYCMQPRWYGAADIKLPKTTLTCNEPVIDYSGNGKLKKTENGEWVAPWLHEQGITARMENDYYAKTQLYKDEYAGVNAIKSCQWNVRRMKPEKLKNGNVWDFIKWKEHFPEDIAPTFAGRCTHHYEKTPKHDALQGCESTVDAPEFRDIFIIAHPTLEAYSSFVNGLTANRSNLCGIKCEVPGPANLTDIQNFNDTSGESFFSETFKYNNESREQSKVERLMAGRKYHAVLCTIWTMFLTPLGIYCARYFKETCMNVDCTGIHFWFWVHIATAVVAVAAFISSLSGIWSNLETWGRNTNSGGVWHRTLGYFSIVLFTLMMIVGGLRPVKRKIRLIFMTAHSVIGLLIYFLNTVAMIVSFYIPASPTVADCDELGFTKKFSSAIFPIVLWICTDACLHIAMTIMQLVKDNSLRVRRRWYCPIIPIIPSGSTEDFVGSTIRKITLLVYTGTAFIFTTTAVSVMGEPPDYCKNKTGNSTCNEPWGCSGTALAFFHKLNNTKRFFGKYGV